MQVEAFSILPSPIRINDLEISGIWPGSLNAAQKAIAPSIREKSKTQDYSQHSSLPGNA
jgi:hypothetical protein